MHRFLSAEHRGEVRIENHEDGAHHVSVTHAGGDTLLSLVRCAVGAFPSLESAHFGLRPFLFSV